MFNKQLKNIERAFLDTPTGLSRNSYEHMIYAPSVEDAYGGNIFPSLTDAIYNYKKSQNSSDLIDKIKMSLSVVVYSINSAIAILKQPLDFRRA
jgi:hypothetical protein